MSIRRVITLLLTGAAVLLAADVRPGFATRDPRYKLKATDVLDIQYRYTPEFNQTISVQPDGFISLSIVGDVRVGGLTVNEARTAVLTKAKERLTDPEVAIALKEFEKPYFVVGGEVGAPGRYEMRGKVHAIQAIAMAGGFRGPTAKHSQVLLLRPTENDDLAETRLLNLKDLKKLEEQNIELQPGDTLLVPQNRISKVERIIRWVNVGVFWNPLP